jgi:hypothetical protein
LTTGHFPPGSVGTPEIELYTRSKEPWEAVYGAKVSETQEGIEL